MVKRRRVVVIENIQVFLQHRNVGSVLHDAQRVRDVYLSRLQTLVVVQRLLVPFVSGTKVLDRGPASLWFFLL
jgi:hypothetical protein